MTDFFICHFLQISQSFSPLSLSSYCHHEPETEKAANPSTPFIIPSCFRPRQRSLRRHRRRRCHHHGRRHGRLSSSKSLRYALLPALPPASELDLVLTGCCCVLTPFAFCSSVCLSVRLLASARLNLRYCIKSN